MARASQYPTPGVVGLLIRRGSVLLIRRRAEPNRGRWSLPGGGVHKGETVREAVVREMREETGYVVVPEALVDVVDVLIPRGRRPKYHFVVTVFRCRPVGGRLHAASDAAAAKWIRLRDTPKIDITENTRAILLQLAKKRPKRGPPRRRRPHM